MPHAIEREFLKEDYRELPCPRCQLYKLNDKLGRETQCFLCRDTQKILMDIRVGFKKGHHEFWNRDYSYFIIYGKIGSNCYSPPRPVAVCSKCFKYCQIHYTKTMLSSNDDYCHCHNHIP